MHGSWLSSLKPAACLWLRWIMKWVQYAVYMYSMDRCSCPLLCLLALKHCVQLLWLRCYETCMGTTQQMWQPSGELARGESLFFCNVFCSSIIGFNASMGQYSVRMFTARIWVAAVDFSSYTLMFLSCNPLCLDWDEGCFSEHGGLLDPYKYH